MIKAAKIPKNPFLYLKQDAQKYKKRLLFIINVVATLPYFRYRHLLPNKIDHSKAVGIETKHYVSYLIVWDIAYEVTRLFECHFSPDPPVVHASLGRPLTSSSIKELDDVYFSCSVDANPPASTITWFHEVICFPFRLCISCVWSLNILGAHSFPNLLFQHA